MVLTLSFWNFDAQIGELTSGLVEKVLIGLFYHHKLRRIMIIYHAASGRRKRRHLLESLWTPVKEELVLQEVGVVAQLQRRVSAAAGELPQPGLRVWCQQLLWQHVATSPNIDDEEVERVSETRRRRLAEENTGVQRRGGGAAAAELRPCHRGGAEAHGRGGWREELMEESEQKDQFMSNSCRSEFREP